MVEVKKSRELSGADYYDIIQLEWITLQVRHLVYDRIDDKTKYKKWAEGKKEKIDEYAQRHKAKSIFNSPELREMYFSRFFNEFGLPNFEYKDEGQKEALSRWDKIHYFRKGTEIEVGNVKTTVFWNSVENDSVEVIENGCVKFYPYTYIKRNLKKELLKYIQ